MKNFTHDPKNALRIGFAAVAVWTALATVSRADDLRQVRVSYADLNVQTEAGAAVLFQRIRSAAERVCEVAGTRDLGQLTQVKACTDHAIAGAVEQINLPTLTKVYDVKFGVTPNFTILASR
jgi:UrcA family protein